ncbi:MAG: PLP-dependent aminotransferase family protein [Phycisphaeraceae bacterium]|nr:PLP-dependent aminotransferase family protein [Phycisphaeraceae bacterium]
MSSEPLAFELSQRGHRTTDQPISYLMAEALRRPNLISLAAGFVDDQTLPREAVAEAAAQLLSDPQTARSALQYGTTQGYSPLREAICEHLNALDHTPGRYQPQDVVVTTGSQQLLHLLTEVLIDPGGIVVTAWPTYFVYTGVLEAFGAQVRGVDMDEQGIIPEALDETLSRLEREGHLPGAGAGIVYITSYHQNPTGLTLSAQRRPRIVDIVRRHSEKAGRRILIVEDAAYRELTFHGEAPPSLRSFDEKGEYVALLQTFSKPFAPGMKTGYGLLPRDLVGSVLLQKTGRDFGSSNFNQQILNLVLRNGAFEAHVKKLCAAYAVKRDAMLAALDEHLGNIPGAGVTWTKPAGGLYVWLTLPPGMDAGRDGRLFGRSLEQGVLFVPGEYCYPPDPTRQAPGNTIRLSFGVADAQQIRRGVERLGQAIASLGRE